MVAPSEELLALAMLDGIVINLIQHDYTGQFLDIYLVTFWHNKEL